MEGHNVSTASDGAAALAFLAQAQPLPSLIVLDLMMPGMDGYEFCRRQARDPRIASIPVLITSASESSRPRFPDGTAAQAGFLRKPFDLDDLFANVGRLAL